MAAAGYIYWDKQRKQHNMGASSPRSSDDGKMGEEEEGPLAAFKRFLEKQAEQATQPRLDPYKIQTREDGTFMVLDTQVPFPTIAYK